MKNVYKGFNQLRQLKDQQSLYISQINPIENTMMQVNSGGGCWTTANSILILIKGKISRKRVRGIQWFLIQSFMINQIHQIAHRLIRKSVNLIKHSSNNLSYYQIGNH